VVFEGTLRRFSVAFGCILSLLLIPGCIFAATSQYSLDNGMELILKENHSSPMVASIIFVKSGSKYESRFENGITHFLEHLLFNGTVHQSREAQDQGIRARGGYINAFTRKDMTAYLVLLPRQHIEYGLTVQADMLFNATFGDAELAKERKVVIEEISRDKDRPGSAADAFFNQVAYGGTDYEQPVLGYKPFIENISREAIVDYWKRYYRPDNMTALIIGDFETAAMKTTLTEIFGAIIPSDSNKLLFSHSDLTVSPTRKDTVANVTQTVVRMSVEGPPPISEAFLPLDLLAQYLAMDGVSPLKKALLEGERPLATDVSIALIPFAEGSRLEIEALTPVPNSADGIVSTTKRVLREMQEHQANPEAIEGIKTSIKCDQIYNAEKLHYYGFMIAPYVMTAGWDFIESYAQATEAVEWSDVNGAANAWFSTPRVATTVVRPPSDSTQVLFVPEEMSAAEVTAYFDTAKFAELDVSQGYPLEFPGMDSVEFRIEDNAEYYSDSLANGLRYIVKSSPESRVFAMNVLGRNRSLLEPASQSGIGDFVNRCMEKGTVTRSEEELAKDLAGIGANVTLYDNPWIPYDDRYTTRRFTFAKFETIDDFAERGFYLFTEMLMLPAFDSAAIESVRGSMLAMIARDRGSTRKQARNGFYSVLQESDTLSSFSLPISGTAETIGSLAREDLLRHHSRLYRPNNMILSIATNQSIETVRGWLDRAFGRIDRLRDPEPVPLREIPRLVDIKENHVPLESDQVVLYMGSPLPGISDPDVASLRVASQILSERLFGTLREKEGLAYTVGASLAFDRDIGWFYASIGTGSENYQRALDGIVLQIEKLKLDGPTTEELATAKNQILGRMSTARLSRINQAYYLGVNAYLGLGLNYDQSYLTAVSQVSSSSLRRAMARWIRTDAFILSSAGTK